jgi:hypothetical protein
MMTYITPSSPVADYRREMDTRPELRTGLGAASGSSITVKGTRHPDGSGEFVCVILHGLPVVGSAEICVPMRDVDALIDGLHHCERHLYGEAE